VTADAQADTVEVMLSRAIREISDGDWVFTGFHWPVVVAFAARLQGRVGFTQVVEAGGALNAQLQHMPSSTTDFALFEGALCFIAGADVMLRSLAGRYDVTMLDAGTVDVRGRVNSTAIGRLSRPRVRLAGGGGAPDAAIAARRLVLLHGGQDLRRLQRSVEHVTSVPGLATRTLLITRFGVGELGSSPRLLEVTDSPGGASFATRLEELGATISDARLITQPTRAERDAASAALRAADAAGYIAARVPRPRSVSAGDTL
jgi:glutaconate CoA-transferase subunit B